MYSCAPCHVYVLPSSLDKSTGKLNTQGALEGFYRRMTDNSEHQGADKLIYLIKDECHETKRRLDLNDGFFTKVYNFSATPDAKKGQIPDVEIGEADAVRAKLIKEIEWGDDSDELVDALDKFQQIEPTYENAFGIRPCLIIQISNKDKGHRELEEIIKPALVGRNLQWMYIVGDGKDCDTNSDLKGKPVSLYKKYAKSNSSLIEVIIFKLAISEGWDIPRANMFYQIRDTKSERLSEQVLGRVRRNPVLLDFENYDEEAQKLACTAWVWGEKPLQTQKPIEVKVASKGVQDEIQVKTTILKEYKLDADSFSVDEALVGTNKAIAHKSIFELYRNLEQASGDIQALSRNYVKNYQDWFTFTENLSDISKSFNTYICDYEKSMELLKDEDGKVKLVSVPTRSRYYELPDSSSLYLPNQIWRRIDGGDMFTFDSKAEEDFVQHLQLIASSIAKKDESRLDLGDAEVIYLWGRNYPNNDIRYAYYSGGSHFSYPDFILKDTFNRIHIFEVKSVNEGGRFTGEQKAAYEEKIRSLAEAYKHASLLTSHVFYLPVKVDNSWQISKYENGNEELLTVDTFKAFLKTVPSS